MEDNYQRPAWMSDGLVRDIPQEKLDFLEKVFREGQGKNQKEMLAFLMPLMKKINAEGLRLTPQEMTAAISAIKKHSSEKECEKIDQLLRGSHVRPN